jgi:hypothetical protein
MNITEGRWLHCGVALENLLAGEGVDMQMDDAFQPGVRRHEGDAMKHPLKGSLSDEKRFVRVRALELIAKDDEVIVDTLIRTAQRVPVKLSNPEAAEVVAQKIINKFKEPGEAQKAVDMVNNPPHYTSHPSGVECIQVTEHMNFCVGNAIKYLWRADNKGATLEDLKKARWYLDREIARRGQ